MTGDERNYAVLEIEIIAEKKRFRFVNYGFEMTVQKVVPDPMFKGFMALSTPKTITTRLAYAMESLVAHAVDVLDGKAKPLTTLAGAIQTQEACLALLHSLKKKK
jgi:hypothetical protein